MKIIISILLCFYSAITFSYQQDNSILNNHQHLTKLYGTDLNAQLDKRVKELNERAFVFKNTPYKEIKNGLPLLEQQLVLCSSAQGTWLQLENYEFLLDSSKMSNQLVVAYIGLINGQKITPDWIEKQKIDTKYVIALFDPESVYVFQQAIITYWDQIAIEQLSLTEGLEIGFAALNYHFGVTKKLSTRFPAIAKTESFAALSGQIEVNLDKYRKKQHEMQRIAITSADLDSYKALGFSAYYPNPAYLGDMAWSIRPAEMTYWDYANISKLESNAEASGGTGLSCKPEIFTRSSVEQPDAIKHCQEFVRAGYPQDQDAIDDELRASDFSCKSSYVFRGDGRSLQEIHDIGGFLTSKMFTHDKFTDDEIKDPATHRFQRAKSRKDATMNSWGAPYIATSTKFGTAKTFGYNDNQDKVRTGNVYLLFAHGGVDIPMFSGGQNTNHFYLSEIAIPLRAAWEDIYGFRPTRAFYDSEERYNKGILVGPVLFRTTWVLKDGDNFWQTLQIFGGKPQCADITRRIAILKQYFSDLAVVKTAFEQDQTIDEEKIAQLNLSNYNQFFEEGASFLRRADRCYDLALNMFGLPKARARNSVYAQNDEPITAHNNVS